MRTELHADAEAELARELLRLCQSALASRQLAVAEHLLRAIEEMARAKPELAQIEQEAYLQIAQSAAFVAPAEPEELGRSRARRSRRGQARTPV